MGGNISSHMDHSDAMSDHGSSSGGSESDALETPSSILKRAVELAWEAKAAQNISPEALHKLEKAITLMEESIGADEVANTSRPTVVLNASYEKAQDEQPDFLSPDGGRSSQKMSLSRAMSQRKIDLNPIHQHHSMHASFHGCPQLAITRNVVKDLTADVLVHIDSWEFDVFLLDERSGGHALTTLAWYLFTTRGIFHSLDICPEKMMNYFVAIEEGYLDNPYHNKLHGCDVMANSYFSVISEEISSFVTELDFMCTLIAAGVHDFRHPGRNNPFQIASKSELALLYNDQSVLENYHVSEAFRLMKDPDMDILADLSQASRLEARETIVTMVLATDMREHMKMSKALHKAISEKPDGKWFDIESRPDRLQILGMLLHVADLGNPVKPLPLYLRWTDMVIAEFYEQGDEEKALGLPVSPMCDRTAPDVAKSQLGFIDFVISPMHELWKNITPSHSDMYLECIARNRQHWADVQARANTASN